MPRDRGPGARERGGRVGNRAFAGPSRRRLGLRSLRRRKAAADRARLPARGSRARHARRRRPLQHPEGGRARRVPGRDDRRLARLQLHGARGRGGGRSGDGVRRREDDLGCTRLRTRAQPRARRGPDRGLRLHGLRGGDLRRADVQGRRTRGRAARCPIAARLPDSDLVGLS